MLSATSFIASEGKSFGDLLRIPTQKVLILLNLDLRSGRVAYQLRMSLNWLTPKLENQFVGFLEKVG